MQVQKRDEDGADGCRHVKLLHCVFSGLFLVSSSSGGRGGAPAILALGGLLLYWHSRMHAFLVEYTSFILPFPDALLYCRPVPNGAAKGVRQMS